MNLRFEVSTTTILLGINILLFILTSFFSVLFGSNVDALEFLGGDIYSLVVNGQIWRILTATFLHANIFHLAVNMYALYYFGSFVESQYGGKKLFVLYVLSGITGSLLSTFVTAVSLALNIGGNPFSVGVGASGALFGILGYVLVMPSYYVNKQQLYYILILNLLIGFAFAGLIDNWAHIGGLLGGMALGYLDNNSRVFMEPKNSYYASIILVVVSFAALILFNIYQILSL